MGTLEQLRSSILTSVYGRRLGLKYGDFLVGPKALVRPIQQTLTSGTTATGVTNYGITGLDATTGAASTASSVGSTELGCTWVMDAPEPGVEKVLYKASATGGSTMPVIVEFGPGVTAFDSSFGSTYTGALMNAVGQFIRVIGLSTGKWTICDASTGVTFASSN